MRVRPLDGTEGWTQFLALEPDDPWPPSANGWSAWQRGLWTRSGRRDASVPARSAGTVILSMMRTVVGAKLTAMLDNPDGDVTGKVRQWAKTVDYAASEGVKPGSAGLTSGHFRTAEGLAA